MCCSCLQWVLMCPCVCDWQEPSYVKLLKKIRGLLTCWLNTSPPVNPPWLPGRLPLTRAGQRNPRWNIVTERVQSKQWARTDFHHSDRPDGSPPHPHVETKELRLIVGARPCQLRPVAALLLFHLLSVPQWRRQWDKKDATDGWGCN